MKVKLLLYLKLISKYFCQFILITFGFFFNNYRNYCIIAKQFYKKRLHKTIETVAFNSH